MEDNLVFALEKGCSLNSTRAGQHLTIRSSWDRGDRIVYESIDFSRLRSLTVFGKWESFFISSKNVNMRLLRVLDLEGATYVINEDLEKIAKLLTRLKFLSIRGCREITHLPSSMGNLRQLQTLDIRHTSIAMLPLFITKLEKLRYLRAGTTEAWDWDGDVLLLTVDGEEDKAPPSSTQEGDVVSTDSEEQDRASSSAQVVTDLPVPSSATAQAVTNYSPIGGGRDSTASSADVENNRTHTLVSSLLSKLCGRGGGGPAAGVTVPADIGKLAVLNTLGVVKVSAQCGNKAIFKALEQLTQLRKLGVSGINKGNITVFCSAICGLAHLKSLSVELDDGKLVESDDLAQLQRVNPDKFKLDMTIARPEEFQTHQDAYCYFLSRLRIRLIQDGELTIGPYWRHARVVEIQCSSVLHVKFDNQNRNYVFWNIEVLKVHFSGGSGSRSSSLKISGLSNLMYLKEVWLKGYTDAHKQYMKRKLQHQQRPVRPVLKLVRPRWS